MGGSKYAARGIGGKESCDERLEPNDGGLHGWVFGMHGWMGVK